MSIKFSSMWIFLSYSPVLALGLYNNKMQFGPLSTRQAIDKRFQELRTLSRQQLLAQIYSIQPGKETGKEGKPLEATVQRDLSDAFSVILHSYDFDKANPIVLEIAQLFHINLDSFRAMEPREREKTLREILQARIEEGVKVLGRREEEAAFKVGAGPGQQNHFQWLGLRTKYNQLRPIFEEILLEKVKLFDNQLTRLSETSEIPAATGFTGSTGAGGKTLSTGKTMPTGGKTTVRSKTQSNWARRVQSDIAEQFCDVKIRDKSEFLLRKWGPREEEEFTAKKAAFRSNLKINNVPVLFQFVKKYTETVKARDNIYRKWEQRERTGITPEEVRYLCATSLFLNSSLAPSEKHRIKNNLQAAGPTLVSRLETNIAQKIIETYRHLMKRVSDLRAKYYEELTYLRKQEQRQASRIEENQTKRARQKDLLLKYKAMFQRVVGSERMRLKLNPRLYPWLRLFADNLKRAISKEPLQKGHSEAVFRRLAETPPTQLLRLKVKHPSSKIIKREDQYSHRLKYRTYLPSERFHYEPSFEQAIGKFNRLRLTNTYQPAFRRQLTGGPRREESFIIVDLSKKEVFMSSPSLLRHVITIQAKWRSVYQRRRFLRVLEEARERQKVVFAEKLQSLKRLYPIGRKVDLRAVQGRLRRMHMKLVSILQPYVRAPKRPTNTYTSFCANSLSPSELKSKHARNGQIRLGQFARMVQQNQYGLLLRSGIVITSRQINGTVMSRGANPMWWAVLHSNLELTKRFLEGGGDPNSVDEEENTCLHIAVKNGDLQIVFLLLDYGADLNRKNNKKVSCLFHASKHMLKLLGLEDGSVLGDKDNNSLFYRRSPQEETYPDHLY